MDAAGCLQLCTGQRAGCEAAVHAMREIFADEGTEGILLVDASNAFNSLNRRAALLNMFHLCSPLATVLTNTYQSASHLFIDGSPLLSQEGTTQGDPLAMPMYTIGIIPVIQQLMGLATQVWYADAAAARGSLRLGWSLSKSIWLQLNASLMVQASRLRLLAGPIWVRLLVLKISSQTTHRITFLSRFKVY